MTLLSVFFPGLLFAQLSTNQAGWLHAQVLDIHGAVIPGIGVSVSSPLGPVLTSMSDTEGKVKFSLQAGVYTLVATGNNILPYRRASVTVPAGQARSVIIRPVFHGP